MIDSLTEFGKQESTIWSLALSCDHQNLLSGSSDGFMKLEIMIAFIVGSGR